MVSYVEISEDFMNNILKLEIDYIELLDVYEINSDEYLDFINKNKYIVNNFNE